MDMALFTKGRGVLLFGLLVTSLTFVAACTGRGSNEPTETSGDTTPGVDTAAPAAPGTENVTEGLAGGALDDTFPASEAPTAQPDFGAPTVTPETTTPAPNSGVVLDPTGGTLDNGAAPAGGTSTGAGGTAQAVDAPLFVLGVLVAAGGMIVLARRRLVQGSHSE
ncbi:MAG: hypothetical protein ACRDZO_08855 [Egibacteraceae bacterium]